jgi:hypothetical protein
MMIFLPTCRNLRKTGGYGARVTPLGSQSTTWRRTHGVLADQPRMGRVFFLARPANEGTH